MDASELVKVDLGNGDSPYHLRYTLGAIKRLKQKFGKSFLKGELLSLDEEYLPDVIYEGLVENRKAVAESYGLLHRPITLEALEDRIDLSMLAGVLKSFAEAIK